MKARVSLDASFDNIRFATEYRWLGEVNNTKAYITSDEMSRPILIGCYTVLLEDAL
jgi:hypothetical protein